MNTRTTKGARLRALLAREDRVLTVLHPPTATHARIMERAGCEAGFVGTGGVVGSYTGLADVGALSMTECVQIAGWVAFLMSEMGDVSSGNVIILNQGRDVR